MVEFGVLRPILVVVFVFFSNEIEIFLETKLGNSRSPRNCTLRHVELTMLFMFVPLCLHSWIENDLPRAQKQAVLTSPIVTPLKSLLSLYPIEHCATCSSICAVKSIYNEGLHYQVAKDSKRPWKQGKEASRLKCKTPP